MSAALIEVRSELTANAIGEPFKRAHSSHRDSVQCLLEAGQQLRDTKRGMSHGDWIEWVQANRETLGFGLRTAQRLLNAAKATATTHLNDEDAAELNRRIWGNLSSEPSAPRERSPVLAAAPAILPTETDRLLTALELAWAYFRDRDPCDTPKTPEALKLAQNLREWIEEWVR